MEIVTDGLEFPEGPIACSDGSVLLVEIKRKTLTRVLPNGSQEVVAELGGGPNGAAVGPDGAIYVTNNGGFSWSVTEEHTVPGHAPEDYAGGSIQRVDPKTGAVTTLYTECDGRPLRGPNDLVFDRHGGLWFTDLGKTLGEQWYTGAVYYARPDGSKIVRARDALFSPNGIGLSPQEDLVHVADTRTGRLWSYRIQAPGVLEPPASRWSLGRCVSLPGYQLLDSLAVEADGKVCVATIVNGGVTVFEGDGVFAHVSIPEDRMITNICFGGEDMRDAWITSSGKGRLLKTRWPRPGLRLNFNL
jgi:gluconolactonase